MKALLISDIHGNLPALEMVLNKTLGLDLYISLGDVVNYGPWSNECVELIDEIPNFISIKGNHEVYFIEQECDSKNFLCSEFYKVCIENFKHTNIIKDYLDHYDLDGFLCRHTLGSQYIYQDSNLDIDRNYIIGHSHKQYKVMNNGFYLINPGSLGQNREHINVISYAIFDTETLEVEFKNEIYDVEKVISEMKRKDYPLVCVDYYNSKKRK